MLPLLFKNTKLLQIQNSNTIFKLLLLTGIGIYLWVFYIYPYFGGFDYFNFIHSCSNGYDFGLTVRGSNIFNPVKLAEAERELRDIGYSETGKIIYSPFSRLIFSVFNGLSNVVGYLLITLISVLLYIYSFKDLFLKKWKERGRFPLIFSLMLAFSFLSYGIFFELQRGQWNLIAISLAIISINLFRKDRRVLSLFLMSISIHLKIYPIILAVFVFNWKLTRKEVLYFISFLIFNLFLLCILGFDFLRDYIDLILKFSNNPYVWDGNLSIFNFSKVMGKIELFGYFFSLNNFLLIFTIIPFLTLLFFYVFKNKHIVENHLFFISIILCLVLPSVSHDYKLSLLMYCIISFYYNGYFNSMSVFEKLLFICLVINVLLPMTCWGALFGQSKTVFLFSNKFITLLILEYILLCDFLLNLKRNKSRT